MEVAFQCASSAAKLAALRAGQFDAGSLSRRAAQAKARAGRRTKEARSAAKDTRPLVLRAGGDA